MAHLTKEGMKNIALACKEAVEAHEKKYGKDFPFEPQSSWQGLSDNEIDKEALKGDHAAYFALGALWANQALKEKNHGS